MAGTRRRISALIASALVALVVAGCGGGAGADGPAAATKARPLGKMLGGSVATLANCRDWNGGPRDRKLATIADIRNQVNRDDTGIETPPLSDSEAMQLFDRECARPWSKSLRLYVMYARAAGWAPLLRD
jgi:hypothetical protein